MKAHSSTDVGCVRLASSEPSNRKICRQRRAKRGEFVRSKSEVIIADALLDNKINYICEKELVLNGGEIKSPDFTIEDAESGSTYYWEHCGMMQDENYRRRWEAKKKLYEHNGIVEGRNLIVTYDKPDGSIDSQEIRRAIKKYLS